MDKAIIEVVAVKDSVLQVTVAGLIGAAVMNLVMYALLFLGLDVTMPWAIAADVFLTAQLAGTPLGIAIGLVGTVALSIASAALLPLVLVWTGLDFAILKGILATNAFSFVTMGLFMPLLRISPQVQRQPLTNLVALGILTVTGAVMGSVISWARMSHPAG